MALNNDCVLFRQYYIEIEWESTAERLKDGPKICVIKSDVY